MIDERSLIAGTKALSAGYAAGAKADFLLVPPYTYRDVLDMYAIKDRLDWLFAEIKAGHELREDIHGPTIRNISAIHHALVQKERAYRRDPENHITTHYIWRTRDDDKVRPEHAANTW